MLSKFGYDYTKEDCDSKIITGHKTYQPLSCFFIALHELITLIKEPQKLDFNAIEPEDINAAHCMKHMSTLSEGNF